jgi:predicted XRE-type DNA-binding protein
MTDKKYDSVAALLSDVSEDPQLVAEVRQTASDRELIKHLIAHRVKADMSQKALASKLKCTQSRISKMEQCNDADLRLGELEEYLGVLDLRCRIMIASKSMKAVDEIKFHAFRIRELLTNLVNLVSEDEAKVSDGIAKFACFEVPLNLLKLVSDAVQHLPQSVLERVVSSVHGDGCLVCDSTDFQDQEHESTSATDSVS